MDVSTLVAKAHIPQSEALELKIGDPAEIKIQEVDEPVKGRVSLVSPALDPGSTTIEVWVEARKPNPALKPGMTVSLRMTAKTVNDAIVVPTNAVFKNDEGSSYVVVAGSDQKAHQKTIQVGVTNQTLTQAASGINAGDSVITSGGYAIPDGTVIQIQKPGQEEKQDSGDSATKPEGAQKEQPSGKPAKGQQ
jgi:RND family efflux transporter MFP subunit